MIIRTVLVAGALATGVTAALAQQNILAQRQALMKGNGQQAAIVTRMVRGDEPFDAAKVQVAFNQWAETAAKFPELFPESSRGGKTRALPAVWTKRAEFVAAAQKFGKDVDDYKSKVATLDGLKAALPVIGQHCGDCHTSFRRSQ
jgi:cytochrome c556